MPFTGYDLVGQKFGMLTVRCQAPTRAKNVGKSARYFECVCECGKVVVVRSDTLRLGKQVSCGCKKKTYMPQARTKWTPEDHEILSRLKQAKHRCLCKTHVDYKNYGGRGITIYEPWLKDPRTFIEWAKYNGFKKELVLERIDKDGNFEPGNLRFVEHQTYSGEPRDERTGYFIRVGNQNENVETWGRLYGLSRPRLNKIYETEGHDAAAAFIQRAIDYLNSCRNQI